jgi:hypothetical protein
MSERVKVRVLLLFGDQAEVVADVPPAERGDPERYPAADIAAAVGVPVSDLPGQRLTAEVGEEHRLRSGWAARTRAPGRGRTPAHPQALEESEESRLHPVAGLTQSVRGPAGPPVRPHRPTGPRGESAAVRRRCRRRS